MMRSLAVLRYTIARCAPLQSWVPVWITFALIISIGYVSAASVGSSLGLGAIVLVPISAWMAIATVVSEPADQSAALAVQSGGVIRYRLLLSLAAFVASLALLPLSLGYALLRTSAAPGATELIGMLEAQVAAVATGTAIGAAVVRPTVRRAAVTFLVGLVISTIFVAIPSLPPVRLMIDIVADGATPDLGSWTAILLATMIIAGGVCWLAGWSARRRTLA